MRDQLKRYLSYFIELPLERRQSALSGNLALSYRGGRLCLSTEKAIYSYEDLYHNFSQSFAQIRTWPKPGSRVLILGMGLGSIIRLLEKEFGRDYHYTAVELDPEVIALAQNYTLPKLRAQVEIRCAAAQDLSWLNEVEAFDWIMVDVFVDNLVPQALETAQFLHQLAAKMRDPESMLWFNRLSYNPELQSQSSAYFEQVFKARFPKAEILALGGNSMLINRHL